jgi:hypothetical protein
MFTRHTSGGFKGLLFSLSSIEHQVSSISSSQAPNVVLLNLPVIGEASLEDDR